MHEPVWLEWYDYPGCTTWFQCRRCQMKLDIPDEEKVLVPSDYNWEEYLIEEHAKAVAQ